MVTPLAIGAAADSALPVVRGWAADAADAPAAPPGRGELVGWLQPPEGTGEVDRDPTDDVLPQLRIADVIQHVDQDLYGAYAVVADRVAPGDWPVGDAATNPGTDGLSTARLEALPDAGRFTAVRNLLYALEWWVFGGFAAFVWWRWVQDTAASERRGRPAGRGADAADDPVVGHVSPPTAPRTTASRVPERREGPARRLPRDGHRRRRPARSCCVLVGAPAEVPRRARAATRSSSASGSPPPRGRARLALHDLPGRGVLPLPPGRLGAPLHARDAAVAGPSRC